MNKVKNIPVQAAMVVSTIGDITPIWFRYEDEEHHIQKVTISDVLDRKESHYCGQEEILFTCKAIVDYVEKVFILRYIVERHKMMFYQMLN